MKCPTYILDICPVCGIKVSGCSLHPAAQGVGMEKVLKDIHKTKTYLGKKTRFGWFLLEYHADGCTCSYCKGKFKIHYGLNIPKNWKAKNSWYVIKFWPGWYLRWTNSWLSYFK